LFATDWSNRNLYNFVHKWRELQKHTT
jgi:hypothetical protein